MQNRLNPDGRSLPDGWYEHFDDQSQIWYYVQTSDPPQVSLTHPAEMAPVPPQVALDELQSSSSSSPQREVIPFQLGQLAAYPEHDPPDQDTATDIQAAISSVILSPTVVPVTRLAPPSHPRSAIQRAPPTSYESPEYVHVQPPTEFYSLAIQSNDYTPICAQTGDNISDQPLQQQQIPVPTSYIENIASLAISESTASASDAIGENFGPSTVLQPEIRESGVSQIIHPLLSPGQPLHDSTCIQPTSLPPSHGLENERTEISQSTITDIDTVPNFSSPPPPNPTVPLKLPPKLPPRREGKSPSAQLPNLNASGHSSQQIVTSLTDANSTYSNRNIRFQAGQPPPLRIPLRIARSPGAGFMPPLPNAPNLEYRSSHTRHVSLPQASPPTRISSFSQPASGGGSRKTTETLQQAGHKITHASKVVGKTAGKAAGNLLTGLVNVVGGVSRPRPPSPTPIISGMQSTPANLPIYNHSQVALPLVAPANLQEPGAAELQKQITFQLMTALQQHPSTRTPAQQGLINQFTAYQAALAEKQSNLQLPVLSNTSPITQQTQLPQNHLINVPPTTFGLSAISPLPQNPSTTQMPALLQSQIPVGSIPNYNTSTTVQPSFNVGGSLPQQFTTGQSSLPATIPSFSTGVQPLDNSGHSNAIPPGQSQQWQQYHSLSAGQAHGIQASQQPMVGAQQLAIQPLPESLQVLVAELPETSQATEQRPQMDCTTSNLSAEDSNEMRENFTTNSPPINPT